MGDTNMGILGDVLHVREALIKNNFWDQETVARFIELFQGYIECIKYDYDPASFTISLRIKKTAVRKIPNYRAEVQFYYNIIGQIMMVILKDYKDKIIKCLMSYFNPNNDDITYQSVYNTYFTMTTNPTYLYNLANVQCIMDNVVQIIL